MSDPKRLLALGGHDFDHRPGNQALVDHIIELAGFEHPRICLLPTASGDPTEQIARFRRCFGERECAPSEISLFRLGEKPLDLREHLLAQDIIYVSGGSLVNLLAIWRAHRIDEILREAWEKGILLVGQSAGAMCWFDGGITSSSGIPAPVAALGLLPGSVSVHYHRDPERRRALLGAVETGVLPPGLGLDDQAGVLFEGSKLKAAISARPGAGVWRVSPAEEGGVREARQPAERLVDSEPAIGGVSAEIIELRRTLALQAGGRRGRPTGSGPGRL